MMILCGELDIVSVPEIFASCDSLFFALLWKFALRLLHNPSFQKEVYLGSGLAGGGGGGDFHQPPSPKGVTVFNLMRRRILHQWMPCFFQKSLMSKH